MTQKNTKEQKLLLARPHCSKIDTIERTVKVNTGLCDDEDSCNLEEEFPINYDYLATHHF
jgi:hypothetical protein